MQWRTSALVVVVTALATAANSQAPVCGFDVVASYPHDAGAFTQGLVFTDGFLYEGTGRHGESALRRLDLETGEVIREHRLAEDLFGEGIAVHGHRIIQLTWLAGTGFVYDRESLEPLGSFAYEHEGWGVTSDGERLIVSDGSSVLRLWDPEELVETGRLQVRDSNGPVQGLNELEFVGGEVMANVYADDRIARIDPVSGEVIAWIDLSGLLDPRPESSGVLNGIAFDGDTGRLFVTGKNWPRVFEIEIVGCGESPDLAEQR